MRKDEDGFLMMKNEMQKVHEHVRLAGRTPSVANLFATFIQDKGNGLEGFEGQRLLHACCPCWSFFGGVIEVSLKKSGTIWPSWMHAYLKGRRREAAMMVQRIVSWVLDFLGLSFYTDFKGMKNAFACAKSERRRRRIISTFILPECRAFMAQRVETSIVRLTGHCGKTADFVPGCGNIIGSAEGADLFSGSFETGINEWREKSKSLTPPTVFKHFLGKVRCDISVCRRHGGETLWRMKQRNKH